MNKLIEALSLLIIVASVSVEILKLSGIAVVIVGAINVDLLRYYVAFRKTIDEHILSASKENPFHCLRLCDTEGNEKEFAVKFSS